MEPIKESSYPFKTCFSTFKTGRKIIIHHTNFKLTPQLLEEGQNINKGWVQGWVGLHNEMSLGT